ncbi:T9SS type A sorting domain-containing protein [Bacteroides sp.]
MKKTLLMGIALVASATMMGQVPGWNAATRAGEDGVYVLDSIKIMNNRDEPSEQKEYTYDSQNRRVSEVSVKYSAYWATPPFAPTRGDSIAYEYNDKGLLAKASTFKKQANVYTLNTYTTYEYNDNGQIARESVWTYADALEDFLDRLLTEYEYSADGSLITKINSGRPTGSGEGDTTIYPWGYNSKVVYTDFVGVDMPLKVENYTYLKGEDDEEGTWELGYTYTKNTYENGLLMKSEYCSIRTGEEVVSNGHNYTYDANGNVIIDEVLMTLGGVLKADSRTVYTYDDATGLLTKVAAELASGDSWRKDRTSFYYYRLVTSGGTGIQNLDVQGGVQVYYDASAKEINAQAEGGISSISIYSATGMEVVRATVSGERYTQSVSNLEKGLYIVTLVTDGRVYSKKIYVNE